MRVPDQKQHIQQHTFRGVGFGRFASPGHKIPRPHFFYTDTFHHNILYLCSATEHNTAQRCACSPINPFPLRPGERVARPGYVERPVEKP